jgi:hypothetical protein
MNPNILLQSQLNYMYPQYNYPHSSPFNNLRQQQQQTLPSTNIKSRSPSLSPSSSSPDDDKQKQDDPVFPRHSSIDNISSKLNKIAKINEIEQQYNNNNILKTNDENNNPIKGSDKNLPPQHYHHQSYCNTLKNLSTGILNNNKECNNNNNNNKLYNNENASVSTLTITPAAANSSTSSSNSSSNSSINNNSSSNNSVYVPPCTSNGISMELREKLRQNILKRQFKNKYVLRVPPYHFLTKFCVFFFLVSLQQIAPAI